MKKKILITVSILLVVIFVIYNVGIEIGNFKIGKTFDDIETSQKYDFENSDFSKNYLQKDQITVVNLWATWCKPCVEEMPNFKQLQKENPDIDFVFLSIDTDSAKLQNFLQKNPEIRDITFENRDYRKSIRNFLEGRDLNSLIKTDIVPVTYFIKGGRVEKKLEGSVDYTEVKTILESLK
jgi:thiol-disulfide isomerase/thioredoxin